MWQQQNPFRVDHNTGARLLKQHSEPLEFLFPRADSSSYNLIPGSSFGAAAARSSAAGAPELDWQRIAGLVQSPASANSEGSSTSTPDQCPASPALTFCEMPSSRNHGGCRNSVSEMQQKHHHSSAWMPNIPPEIQGGPQVSSDLRWPAVSELPHQTTIETLGSSAFLSEESWNYSLLDQSDLPGSGGYPVAHDQPLVSNIPSHLVHELPQKPACSGSQTSSFGYLGDHLVKKEEEYFLGGRNGLVIDESVLSLHHQRSLNSNNSNTGAGSSTSKIGNFMDLLRQSDRPISDAAAAASQLSQLLSCSQEAPEMWMAHSSRFPAILSEVLPSNSGSGLAGKCAESNKRKLLELLTSDAADAQESRAGACSSAVQQQCHGPMKQQQDEDEPLHDRGAGANDSEMFSKKPRIENSNFPFKMQVRKEKLGERISALQQLVSPFGKTDTASVLLEAIGYIKFLHDQVQVLSSPYMKSKIRHSEHGGDEGKQDLRSRGLCLVPISCTLQLANDNGADYWTPSLHGGLK